LTQTFFREVLKGASIFISKGQRSWVQPHNMSALGIYFFGYVVVIAAGTHKYTHL